MNVRHRVDLTQYERNELEALLSGGKQPARKLKRAQILLAADAGVSDEDIATSRASSLPVSLRSAPGRASSLRARSRLPSTKRRLVR